MSSGGESHLPRFEDVMKQILSVPKSELDEREAEWKKERATQAESAVAIQFFECPGSLARSRFSFRPSTMAYAIIAPAITATMRSGPIVSMCQTYFVIIPQAMWSPTLPAGLRFKSSLYRHDRCDVCHRRGGLNFAKRKGAVPAAPIFSNQVACARGHRRCRSAKEDWRND